MTLPASTRCIPNCILKLQLSVTKALSESKYLHPQPQILNINSESISAYIEKWTSGSPVVVIVVVMEVVMGDGGR